MVTEKKMERSDLPVWWEGSVPEYICYTTLIKVGKKPDIDFTFK